MLYQLTTEICENIFEQLFVVGTFMKVDWSLVNFEEDEYKNILKIFGLYHLIDLFLDIGKRLLHKTSGCFYKESV